MDEDLEKFSSEIGEMIYDSLNISNSDVTCLNDSVENYLTRLDDYGTLIDIVRGDANHTLKEVFPNVKEASSSLNAVFQKVDDLEKLVLAYRNNLNQLENNLNKADKEIGSITEMKKKLMNPFKTSSISNNPSSTPVYQYDPVNLQLAYPLSKPSTENEDA